MDRRAFATGLGAVLAAPLASEAQPPAKDSRVVFFTLNSRGYGSVNSVLDALKQGFRDLGYVVGGNLTLEERFGEGRRELLAGLAREIASMQPRVIVTFGTPATDAAKAATSTLPIVFIGVGDPIGSGFGASLARPGGNLTGFSFVGPDLAAKNLELLKHAFPRISSVAVLSPGEPDHPLERAVWAKLGQSARDLDITLQRVQVPTIEQLDAALAGLAARRPDALLMLNDPGFFANRHRIFAMAAQLRLPAMYQSKELAHDGGLMAYVPSIAEQAKRAADYVDRILKGARPGDLPIDQPTRFELIINLKTAKALGLTIPPSLLLRADQVIE
jgi:putative tryptophan/tyrosine transport system substrate-binding protein